MGNNKPPAPNSSSPVSIDETIVERLKPEEKETEKTFVEKTASGELSESPSPDLRSFHGWRVAESFPARGSEADIFLVEKEGTERILKLYRQGIEPVGEVHERIAILSRKFSEFFVQIIDQGKDDESGRYFELQEYFPLGSLRNLVEKSRLSIPMIRVFLEISSKIICNLHQNGILHLDMKPENILMRSLEPLSIVVTDFGISSLLDETDSKRISGIKGTSLYQPPESLSGVVGKKSDWWALGVILLELLAGEHPFEGMQRQVIYYHLTTKGMPVPGDLPGDWISLLKGLLTRNPERRWGETEVEQWLSGKSPRHFFDDELSRKEPFSDDSLLPHPEWWTKFQIPKNFRGSSFSTLEELVAAFISSPTAWDDGKIQFSRGNIIRWLRSNQDFDRADQLFRLLGEGDFIDLALFRLVYQIRPDLPIAWAGRKIDKAFLESLLKKASESILEGEELLFIENLFHGTVFEILQKNKVALPENIREIFFLASTMSETPMSGFPLPKRASILSLALSDSFRGITPLDFARKLISRNRDAENVFRVAGINGFIPWTREGGLIREDEETLWRVLISIRKILEGRNGKELLDVLEKNRDTLRTFLQDSGGFLEEIIRFLADGRISEAAFEYVSENLKQYTSLETFFTRCLQIPADLEMEVFCHRHLLFLKIKNHAYLFREYLLPLMMEKALELVSGKSAVQGEDRKGNVKPRGGAGIPLDFLRENCLENFEDFILDPAKMTKRGTLGISDWNGIMRYLEGRNIRGVASVDGGRLSTIYSLLEETSRLEALIKDDPNSWRRILNYSVSCSIAGLLLVFGEIAVAPGWGILVLALVALCWAKLNQMNEQRNQQKKIDELIIDLKKT